MKRSGAQKNWRKNLHVSIFITLLLGILVLGLLLCQKLVLPMITFFAPGLQSNSYDLGFYGLYPTQSFASFHLSPPRTSILKWDPVCDDGFILLDLTGNSVTHPGPMVLDAKGNLKWMSDEFQTTTNLKVQSYRGEDYLTFWSGHKEGSIGQGVYYMINSTYQIAHRVETVGAGVAGDLHEFKITGDSTALLTIYNVTQADLTSFGRARTKLSWITDSVFQEVDIATGQLLFEWRASEHGFLGNYLVSFRHLHALLYINGAKGEVLWSLGGEESDFEDLSGDAATNFGWQHDARWVSENDGILTLFDNSMALPHIKAQYSQGRIIRLDLKNRTATAVHSYTSLLQARSSSQGSLQILPDSDGDRVFIGWGSSAAYSEHTVEGELLCETHFGASSWFIWERVKSYRATKVSSWTPTPAEWDPTAVIRNWRLYVSWNGATEVAYWELQGCSGADTTNDEWEAVDIVDKKRFEESLALPHDNGYSHHRVAAMDEKRMVLRHSNVVKCPLLGRGSYAMAALSAFACVGCVVGFLWCRRRRSQWQEIPHWAIYKHNKLR